MCLNSDVDKVVAWFSSIYDHPIMLQFGTVATVDCHEAYSVLDPCYGVTGRHDNTVKIEQFLHSFIALLTELTVLSTFLITEIYIMIMYTAA